MRATTSVFSFFSGAGFLDLGFEQAALTFHLLTRCTPISRRYRYSRRLLGLEEPEYGYYLGGIEELVTGPSDSFIEPYQGCPKSV